MLKSLDLLLINVSKRLIHTTASHCKGHAKWQNIKNIKAANDRQRQLLISRQLRFIRLATYGMLLNGACYHLAAG